MEKSNRVQSDSRNLPLLSVISPLISTSCSSDKGWPFIGSVPFSAIYFSISLRSNTWLDTGETQGCSGTSFETVIKNAGEALKSCINNNTKSKELGGLVPRFVEGANAWPLALAKLASSLGPANGKPAQHPQCVWLQPHLLAQTKDIFL